VADSKLIVRAPEYKERRYIFSTARHLCAARLGTGSIDVLDYESVMALVDPILNRCALRVAVFDGVLDDFGRPEIHGFVAEDTSDASLEFFHVRGLYREMKGTLAGQVARGLVGERTGELVIRRGTSDEALKAIMSAGYKPVVRPRAV
jgi:hypothetical protein